MDIVLERILSLIPKGPDGKYVHGAKTKFAKKIGYNDGAIVAMWENGSSISYNKKLYQIAEEYNVSVEWLQGKTEDKSIKETPDPKIEGVSPTIQELFDFIDTATDAELNELLRYAQFLMSKR
jgi:transcriptional regulator with XRE-family HTH domain|nr:MAG TPA: ESX-1 secretion-associated regulator [Caudoviricetes sp.]